MGGGLNCKWRVGKKGNIKKSFKKRKVIKERVVVESDIYFFRCKFWWEELVDLFDWFGFDGGFKGLLKFDLYGFEVLVVVIDKDKVLKEFFWRFSCGFYIRSFFFLLEIIFF